MTFILFDEIEKANDAALAAPAGYSGQGYAYAGRQPQESICRAVVIFMTSNLGAVEMSEMLQGGIGFTSGMKHDDASLAVLDKRCIAQRSKSRNGSFLRSS